MVKFDGRQDVLRVSNIYAFNKYGIKGLAVEIGGRDFYKMEDDVTRKN